MRIYDPYGTGAVVPAYGKEIKPGGYIDVDPDDAYEGVRTVDDATANAEPEVAAPADAPAVEPVAAPAEPADAPAEAPAAPEAAPEAPDAPEAPVEPEAVAAVVEPKVKQEAG